MPMGKGYKMNVSKGKTPEKVMGSQGNTASIPVSHYKSRQTGSKKFGENVRKTHNMKSK